LIPSVADLIKILESEVTQGFFDLTYKC
jgi:hypothetical protein